MKPLLAIRAIVFGLLLMLYFYICNFFGVADKIELRFFNFVILGLGLWITLHGRAKMGKDFGVKYFEGLKDGLLFTFIASFVFSLSFFAYLWMQDFALVDEFITKGLIGETVTAFQLSAMIIIENVAAGFMISFTMLQYLKYSRAKEEQLEKG